MKKWAVQDAKSRFSHVIELARTQGPQTITKHGKAVAVMVSASDFARTQRPSETPLQFFSQMKGLRIPARRKDLPREVKL